MLGFLKTLKQQLKGPDNEMPITTETLIARMALAARHNLSEYSTLEGETRISIKRINAGQAVAHDGAPLAVAAASEPDAAPPADGIQAPLSGLCYLAPQSGAATFVSVGDRVVVGQTVCIIEAMKVMTSVTAEREGVISEICVADGDTISAGDILMKVHA